MKLWQAFQSIVLVSLLGVAIYFTLTFAKAEHLKRLELAKQQRAKQIATIERQCSLAWPLEGERYRECMEQLDE